MERARYDVFLSHATPDKPVVEELARILRMQGIEPWLDVWNLIPGEPWQEAIEEALESCASCAVCIGPSGTGPWQNEEMRAAIERRVSGKGEPFRVIPVLLPNSMRGEPSRLPSFLRSTTWVEFRETLNDEKVLHRLMAGIRGFQPGPGPGQAVAEGAQPYRGLEGLRRRRCPVLLRPRGSHRMAARKAPPGSQRQPLPRHLRPFRQRQVLARPRRAPRRRPTG
jgi:TIR domain-containing protein